MDYKLDGFLRRYVLVLMILEVQWRPVFPAPAQTSCELTRIKSHTALMKHETNELLNEYKNLHNLPTDSSVPDEVPDSTISGISISEKLQDIYIQTGLFRFHILKVKDYLENLWGKSETAVGALSIRLLNHLTNIETILRNIDPEMSLPTTPPPPELSHDHDYEKKVYGLGVIVRLEDWLTQVLQVLDEVVCDN